MKKSIFLTIVVLFSFKSTAQTAQDSTEKFQLHFQTTVITMHKPGVKAAYTFAGYNSLSEGLIPRMSARSRRLPRTIPG